MRFLWWPKRFGQRAAAAERLKQLRRRADTARDARNFAAAAEFYEAFLSERPDHAGIHVQCGHMHKEVAAIDRAEAHYLRAQSLEPKNPDPPFQLGHLFKMAGRHAEAIAAYDRAVALSPRWSEPLAEAEALRGGCGPVPGDSGPLRGSFDGLFGSLAKGWAFDTSSPDEPAEVELLVDGAVIARCVADGERPDVGALGFGGEQSGFACDVPASVARRSGTEVYARIKGMDSFLEGSPHRVYLPAAVSKWLARTSRLSESARARLRRRLTRATAGQLLSIVMPVYNTRPDWLVGALDSVLGQWCDNWEMLCVDDCSTQQATIDTLSDYAARDSRIQVLRSNRNAGIAASTNKGIRAARGDYVAFLDHDDHLEPDAVYKILWAARTGAELIYSDEILTGENTDDIRSVAARPAFSYDYYISHPYFVHLVCVRRDVAQAVGGWNETLAISGDVDFILRVIERASYVAHIPAVLYRWRTHPGSAGHQMQARVMDAMREILQAHVGRLGVAASVSNGLGFNTFRTDFPDNGTRTLVVVPTRNRVDLLAPCIASMERTVSAAAVKLVVIDHDSDDIDTCAFLNRLGSRHLVMRHSGRFNYSVMNNAAVQTHGEGCEFVLFLNNDVEAIEDGWLERMRSLASRTDVGVVGATLVYEDDRIQHAGVVIGMHGLADHAHRTQPLSIPGRELRNLGYLGGLSAVRDYSAVTGACMLMRRAVFEQVGGFDERQVIGFNDTDLCLRVRKAGYKVLNDSYAVLIHRESATRATQGDLKHPEDSARFRSIWRELLRTGDPFYNPLLNLQGPDHRLRMVDTCDSRAGRVRVRPVVLPNCPAKPLTCGL